MRKRVFHPRIVKNFDQITKNSSYAKRFLNNKYVMNYLNDTLNDIKEKILTDSIRDVREELTISDKLKRIFITPKKSQVSELVGVYKFLTKLIKDMQEAKELPDKLLEMQENGEVRID